MSGDDLREVHGVRCATSTGNQMQMVAREDGRRIIVQSFGIYDASLTPEQARYFAAKLYRLSRRIRDREATGGQGT